MRDQNLLDEYRRSRSDEAFARIVARYINPVFSTCMREVNDRQTAEDLTQAVFLILARKAPSLSPNVALSGWLFNTARLVARNALREERRRRERERKAALMQCESSEWTTIDGELNEALATLSAGDRLAILLRFFDELTMPDIARELGVSTDAAQMRVHRAVDRLRRILVKQGAAISTATLVALLASGAVKTAHAELAGKIIAGGAAGPSLTIIMEGAMKQMMKKIWLAQIKTAACVAVCPLVGLGAVQAYTHRSEAGAAATAKRPTVRGSVTAPTRPAARGSILPPITSPGGGSILPPITPAVAGSIGPEGENTYHVSGGVLRHGEMVPWEVWGRRNPYFYYERKGHDATQDDGETMLRVYGPDPIFQRKAPFAVTSESGSGPFTDGKQYDMAKNLAGGGLIWYSLTIPKSWRAAVEANNLKPITQSGDEQVFEIERGPYNIPQYKAFEHYTVGAKDDRVRRYQCQWITPGGVVESEKADVEYGKPIPEDILHPLDISKITAYDVRPNVPGSLRSMKFHLRTLALDADGNILIEAKPVTPTILDYTANYPRTLDVACQDSQGVMIHAPYARIYLHEDPNDTPSDQLILLSPLEPLKPGDHPIKVTSISTGAAKANERDGLSFSLWTRVTPPMPDIAPPSRVFMCELQNFGDIGAPVNIDLQGVGSSLDALAPRLGCRVADAGFHKKLSAYIAQSRDFQLKHH